MKRMQSGKSVSQQCFIFWWQAVCFLCNLKSGSVRGNICIAKLLSKRRSGCEDHREALMKLGVAWFG